MSNDKIRILFMDDEEYIRDVAEQILLFFGYDVTLACDGEKAFEQYRQALVNNCAHDVIIMDVGVPEGWGAKKAMQEIIKLDQKACGLVSSGYMDDPLVVDFRRYHFRGVLPKPYEMDEVNTVISSIIELVGLRKDR
tara:strand:+ start:2629 stop:3039 length:411 start_codon:yes stop_codon:yes gene_type:complete